MANEISDGVKNRMGVLDLPKPYGILRLSFSTCGEYQNYSLEYDKQLANIWLWHETLGNKASEITIQGLCDLCDCQTKFTVMPRKMPDGDQFAFRANWWMGMLCGCQKSNLDRAAFKILIDGGHSDEKIYHVGHHSNFRIWLSERTMNVTDSQFEQGREPGEIENGIRYEDLTNLSFPAGEFDCLICMEILEHIPDYKSSLSEMVRVLKPGGRAILSFPWLGRDTYEHLIRAEMRADGSINHILPPEYHGDPASSDGILSFRAFGWKILDELRDAGFKKATANFIFGPIHGYMMLANPIIEATK